MSIQVLAKSYAKGERDGDGDVLRDPESNSGDGDLVADKLLV